MIIEELKLKITEAGATEEEADKLILQLSFVIIAEVMKSLPELTQTEESELTALIEGQRYQEVFEVVRAKFSEGEWARVLETQVSPIIQDFLNKVVIS